MEEMRLNITHKRPTLVLDSRFPFTVNMELGQKVQLLADVVVDRMAVIANEDGTDETTTYTFLVNKAEMASGMII